MESDMRQYVLCAFLAKMHIASWSIPRFLQTRKGPIIFIRGQNQTGDLPEGPLDWSQKSDNNAAQTPCLLPAAFLSVFTLDSSGSDAGDSRGPQNSEQDWILLSDKGCLAVLIV